MPNIIVAISTVKDGSMYNRHDHLDSNVIHNREVFLKTLGIEVNQTTRVSVNANERAKDETEDFCHYREIGNADKGAGMRDGQVFVADALITTDVDHAIMLPVADCTGTVIYDPVKRVLMVSHLGRHSLAKHGGEKSVQYLVDHYASDPTTLLVWLTPAPGKDTFPIWALDNQGAKEATLEQLMSAGVKKENITDNPADTTKDPNYYSYSEFLKGNRDEDADYAIVAMMTD
jgi:copper oxidase (laccase) domain-containing protein